MPQLAAYEDRLTDPTALAACLELYFGLHDRASRVTQYANLALDTSLSDERLQAMQQRSLGLMDEVMAAAGFIRSELLVLDVRSADDYEGELGHIPGTRNIPLEQLERHLPELSPYLEKPVALVCTTDRRSKTAAQILVKEGFADVHVVLGGMTQWNKDALPVNPETRSPVPTEE